MTGLSALPPFVQDAIRAVETSTPYAGPVIAMQHAASWFIDSGQSVKAQIALAEAKRLLGDSPKLWR